MQEIKKWWKKVKIWELTEILNWWTPSTLEHDYWDWNILWFTPKDLSDYKESKYILNSIKKITDLWLKKSSAKIVPKNSIILSSRAPVWYVNIITEDFTTNQWCKSLICNDLVSNQFLYYWLKINTETLENISWWATFKELRTQSLKDLEIILPPLSIQQKIASILCKYDDLIKNNNRRIKILEETAQSIYEEWFVKYNFPWSENIKMIDSGNDDFGMIPEGWNIEKVWNLIECYIWWGWWKEEIDQKHIIEWYVIRWTNIPLLKNGNINNIVNRFHTKSNIGSRLLQWWDIVFEVSWWSKWQPVWRSILMNSNLIEKLWNSVIPASFCKKLNPKKWFSYYLYRFLDYIYENRIIEEYQVQSTWITNFKFEPFLSGQDIMLPNEEIISKFNDNLSYIYDEITLLWMNNQNLKETRDLLIPRLVSWELDIESLDVK